MLLMKTSTRLSDRKEPSVTPIFQDLMNERCSFSIAAIEMQLKKIRMITAERGKDTEGK